MRASLLLAEDNEAIRAMFTLGLTNQGFEVRTAPDGRSALASLREAEPDLVLLDVQMPGLTGYEVLEALALPETRHPRVIMLSNLSQPEDVRRAVRLGAIDWIVKSTVTPAGLARRVEQWVRVIGDHRPATTPIDRSLYRDPEGRSLDGSPHAMLVADDFARYVDANQPALDLLNCELPELLGRTVWDVTPNPILLEGIAMWREFLARGEDAGSYELVTMSGETRLVRYLAYANVEPGRHLSIHIG